MKKLKFLIPLLGLPGALLVAGIVLAQSSPNFDLWWSGLTGGGGSRQSSNSQVQDALGQWVSGSAASTNFQVQAGILVGVGQGTPWPTPTPTATAGPPGDAYEDDNTCATAKAIVTDGSSQTHTFHIPGDQDWIKFYALANTTYIIQTSNPGVDSDPVLLLYESCAGGSLGGDDNAFGQTVRLEWDVTGDSRWFYLKLQQFDPSISGPTTITTSPWPRMSRHRWRPGTRGAGR